MGQRLSNLLRYLTALIVAASVMVPQDTNAFESQAVQFATQIDSTQEDPVQFSTQTSESGDDEEEAAFQMQSASETGWPNSASYFAAFVSQNEYPRLAAGQSYKFSVTVKNIGMTPWRQDTVFLGTFRPQDRVPGFVREGPQGSVSGWVKENRIEMALDHEGNLAGDVNENGLIDQEEEATFEFWMTVPDTMRDGVYKEYFNLVAENITWFYDLGIYWDVTVDNLPHARFVEQSPYPKTLKAGESHEFWVRFENTGVLAWREDGPTPVHLGTDRPQDRVPGFIREGPQGSGSGWVAPNRVVLDRDPDTGLLAGDTNNNNQIDTGETARFRFWYTVPETMESGTYQEYFRPVMDNRGSGWMEDFGVFWIVRVDNIAPRPDSVTITPKVNEIVLFWTTSPEAESYKVRFRALHQDVFTVIGIPGSLTSTTLTVAGGHDYEVGVASVDAQGISPFTAQVIHVDSPAEVQARLAAQKVREQERQRIATERQIEEELEEEPIVTGPPGVEGEETRDWRQFWLTLLVILGAAGLATAGYYGYEWWAESRRTRPVTRVSRPEPSRREPKDEEKPKPPTTTRW